MTVLSTNLPQQSPSGDVLFGDAHTDFRGEESSAVSTDPAYAPASLLPFVDGIETVEDGRIRMGILVPDGMEACVAYLTRGQMTNRLERAMARRPPNYRKDTYIATGLFPAGTIQDRGKGRYKHNIALVPLLYADFDLKDVRRIPKQELWEMNQADLDDMLQTEALNVVRAYEEAGVPLHLLLSSGYGLQAFTRIVEGDQCRIDEIGKLLPRMHATLDDAFGRRVIDPGAKDPGHLMRLLGTYNNKYPPLPRPVHALADFSDRTPAGLREIESACQPVYRGASPSNSGIPATAAYGSGANQSIDVDAVVKLIQSEYEVGSRHFISYGLSGVLLKAGVGREQAREAIERLSESDDEQDDRLKALEGTYDRAEKEGERAVAGYTVLQQHLNPETLEKLVILLDESPTLGRELPEFPIDVFPPVVQTLLNEMAACKGEAPVEMGALPLLASVGALIGTRARIVIKEGWDQPPVIWGMVIAPPASMKSPMQKSALAPLKVLQADERRRHRRLEQRDKQENARRRRKESTEPLIETRPPRDYYSTDPTVEATVKKHMNTPGLLIAPDELSMWIKRMNRYASGGQGSDREEHLSMWNGGDVKSDRKTDGKSVYISTSCVGVVGGIQPDKLREIERKSGVDDGFMDRFLPVVLPNRVRPKWTKHTESASAREAVTSLMRSIDTLPFTPADMGDTETLMIPISAEAESVFVEWYEQNADLVFEAGGMLGGMYTKLADYIARFALILHVLKHPSPGELLEVNGVRVTVDGQSSYEHPPMPVSAQTMRDAIRVGEFFRGHMRAFVKMLGKGQHEQNTTKSEDSRDRRNVLHAINCKADDQGWAQHSPIMTQTGLKAGSLTEIVRALEAEGVIERRQSPTKAIQYRIRHPEPADLPIKAA